VKNWVDPNGAELYLYKGTPESSQNYINPTGLSNQRISEKQRIEFIQNKKYPNYHLEKDNFGKPFLNPRNIEINYSHTRDFLFWGEHPKFSIGVDIEYIRPKIADIHFKFVNHIELEQIDCSDLKSLTKIWSAKEAIFKAYGKTEVDFKEDIVLYNLGSLSDSIIKGKFNKHDGIDLEISCKWIDDFIMTSVVWNDQN